MSLIVIIGLCGSGKSSYANELLDYNIFDDFISNFYNGNIIASLKNNEDVCVIDPRLCIKNVFDRYITIFEKYINRNKISLVLFENDPQTCSFNIQQRNDGRRGVIETNNHLTLQYDLNNYQSHTCNILPCYKLQ